MQNLGLILSGVRIVIDPLPSVNDIHQLPMSVSHIRNFCIIAHIDHGKTTLSDRLLEVTNTIANRDKQDQLLDSMDLERERGITIKSHPVSMQYRAKNGEEYTLNLMDTPGHVDFAYEVSRSLAACEGALLIVDAAQGVEAQTMANIHLAHKQGLTIIPVINKIDLPNADLPAVKKQLEDLLAIPADEAIPASAKAGIGIEEILEAVVERIPPPPEGDGILRALVFDSLFDTYRGVVSYIRVFSGALKAGTQVRLMSTNQSYEVKEVGIFTPKMTTTQSMSAGDVGYFIGNIKSTAEIKIGDTLTDSKKPASEPLPGFKEVQPMVYSGIYPINTADFEQLKSAMGKLQINDAAFDFMPESSVALGFGFRCGFLGLLHMEIIQERLRREYNMDIIATYPSVVYEVVKTNGEVLLVDNPANLPDMSVVEEIREPVVKCFVMIPNENIGDIMQIMMEARHRGEHRVDRYPPRHDHGRPPAQRDPRRLSRQDQIRHPWLRLHGLRASRLPRRPHGEARDACERRARGCLLQHRPPRQGRGSRTLTCCEAQGGHPDPDVPGCHPGSSWRQDRCPREHQRHAQERDRQVLRRRHHPQAQAPREAEGR